MFPGARPSSTRLFGAEVILLAANLKGGRLSRLFRAHDGQAKGRKMGDKPHASCLPKLVGASVIADSIGWSRKHVYDLAQRGQIPHHRVGSSVRFDPIKIKAWLDDHEIAA
jgi:excisionase family DNA binding protein